MVYEVDDFDIGDIVSIDTGDKTLVGEILSISETRIKIRKKDSLKAIVQADSIKTIEQIQESVELYPAQTKSLSRNTTVEEKSNTLVEEKSNALVEEKSNALVEEKSRVIVKININDLYETYNTEQDSLAMPWTFETIVKEFKGQEILSQVNGIINSIGSAIKVDKESLDISNANNKTKPAINKLKSIYSETKNKSVLS